MIGCGGPVSRIADVGNPWLDAGIVPFSTVHYREEPGYWAKWFPADFITESFPGQFRNWFYAMLAMSTVLRREAPFRTIQWQYAWQSDFALPAGAPAPVFAAKPAKREERTPRIGACSNHRAHRGIIIFLRLTEFLLPPSVSSKVSFSILYLLFKTI